MVVFAMMHTEVQVMMLKTKLALTEIPTKSRNSTRKIWPFLVYNHDIEKLRINYNANPSRQKFRDEHSHSMDAAIPESFHCAMRPILRLAQLFGILPVSGIKSQSPTELRFKIFSFLTVYSVFIIVMILFITVISMIHMMTTISAETFHTRGGIGEATIGTVFYGNSLLGAILFFWLSSRWTSLQYEWKAMEQYIDSNCTVHPRLRWKFLLISSTVLLLALIEHILSILNNAGSYEWDGSSNSTFRNFLEIYSLRSHAFVFKIMDYNFAFGIYIFIVSKLATFIWNFTDVFVMLVSTGLAERYKFLNKRVAIMLVKDRRSFSWHKVRKAYAVLSALVKKVDDHISPIILLSFGNNLYFICLQLLNGLSNSVSSSILSDIYFFGSFAFLIARTCAVTLFTARIHDQSKRVLPCLYSCSTSSYDSEAQRLEYQLATDDVTLTGLRFFSITRNFMLAVAGAIITYEVVLLQFNNSSL
ncbi:gustatory receptor for sugar taste 64f-like [Hylaeus anthracinus]|uniref:gustatory receptor for sugar taste 64f-like n=1 Tax=Hylaeus anthracinus TaxID=313031 RepID=UPI0023B9316F|nr:gustatory receptor for sugar taste 64f-like [Hylaeus anthracinus]